MIIMISFKVLIVFVFFSRVSSFEIPGPWIVKVDFIEGKKKMVAIKNSETIDDFLLRNFLYSGADEEKKPEKNKVLELGTEDM